MDIKYSSKSLYEKMQDEEYLNTLCERRRRELELARKILGEEELRNSSSISTAYRKAREKWIIENMPPDEQEKFIYQRRPLRLDLLI